MLRNYFRFNTWKTMLILHRHSNVRATGNSPCLSVSSLSILSPTVISPVIYPHNLLLQRYPTKSVTLLARSNRSSSPPERCLVQDIVSSQESPTCMGLARKDLAPEPHSSSSVWAFSLISPLRLHVLILLRTPATWCKATGLSIEE